MKSVHQLTIDDEKALIHSSIRFPQARELVLAHSLTTETRSWFHLNLPRIVPTKQLTRLTIDHGQFPFDQLIRLLRLMPHLSHLTCHCRRITADTAASIKRSKSFAVVSRNNGIRHLHIRASESVESAKLLLALCSQVIVVFLNIPWEVTPEMIRFVLTHNQQLNTVCLYPHQRTTMTSLKNLIESEDLLGDYSLKQMDRQVFLWW